MRFSGKITTVVSGVAVDVVSCGSCPDGVFVWTGPVARRQYLGHIKRPERGTDVMASHRCPGADAAYSSANGHVYRRFGRTGNYVRALRYLVGHASGSVIHARPVGDR